MTLHNRRRPCPQFSLSRASPRPIELNFTACLASTPAENLQRTPAHSKTRAEHYCPPSQGCDRAHAGDYAAFLGIFFPRPL
jgi:hypothetical protein